MIQSTLGDAIKRQTGEHLYSVHNVKAHLYEAILLVNRGIDEAVRGLVRLKRAKESQLDSSWFDEELVLFEDHRARLNSYFCSTLQRSELQDSVRFEARSREYEKNTLDEIQVYRDVRAASEVEQKFRVPVSFETGIAATTYSLHSFCIHAAVMLKRYPDFVHQAPAVQLAFAKLASMRFAWSGELPLFSPGPGPSVARSGA